MPKLKSHVNPGRVLIATIGTGAMLALLASAALATNAPGASPSVSESATASQSAGNTVAGATAKLPSGAALTTQCRVIEDVNGVDKDNPKPASGDRDDMTASPMASASASPMASASASPMATESTMPSATPSSSPSAVVLGAGESAAALDAACDKLTSSDKDDAHGATASATATASASNKMDADDQAPKATASNKADPDDRNGANGDDRNGKNGHSDSHQGRGHSND